MQDKDYHNQNKTEDYDLLTMGFPSDYFVVNPKAPKLINIDVLNMLTRNARSLVGIMIKNYESGNASILDHQNIIELSFMADDYLVQAMQVLKHGQSDNEIQEHIEQALSILSLIQQDGESLSSGFSISDFRIKEALKATHDIIETAKKEIDLIPNDLTGFKEVA